MREADCSSSIWILWHPISTFARRTQSIWREMPHSRETRHGDCPTHLEGDVDPNPAFVPCPAISLDIATERESGVIITVHVWQLSVTESSHSRHKKAVSMSHIEKFDLRAWLVGP